MSISLRFDRPTSVFVGGNHRALLNWTALALATQVDPEFHWTDVRLRGEVLEPDDPLARGRVPESRLSVVHANELTPNEGEARLAGAATGTLIRSEEPPETIRRLVDFLRLPSHTQEVLARARQGGPPIGLVLSNAQRMVGHYPTGTVGPIVRGIVQSGAILILTFADAAPEARREFGTVLRLDGTALPDWRNSTLTVERVPRPGEPPILERHRLSEVHPVADLLAAEFP